MNDKFNIKNVYQGWFTTVLGIIVCGAGVYLLIVQGTIHIDSMLMAPVKDTMRYYSKQGNATAKLWKDEHNNRLTFDFECPPDTITITQEVPLEVVAECPPVREKKEKTYRGIRGFFTRLWDGFTQVSAYVVLAALGIVAIRSIINKVS